MIITNGQTVDLVEDGWAIIMSYLDFNNLKKCHCISKVFKDRIVEKSAAFVLTQLLLDNPNTFAFERLQCLDNIIMQWINPKNREDILAQDSEQWASADEEQEGHFSSLNACLVFGINKYHHVYQVNDPNGEQKATHERNKEISLLHLRANVIREFENLSFSLSPQGFLKITAANLSEQWEKDRGLAIRTIIYMTPYIFSDHPGKNDLSHLFARNINSLRLTLTHTDPIQRDLLLKKCDLNLKGLEILSTILHYLGQRDIQALFNFIKKIHEPENFDAEKTAWKRKLPEWEDIFPGITSACALPTEGTEEEIGRNIFIKLLVVFDDFNQVITEVDSLIHVIKSGDNELLKRLTQEPLFTHSDWKPYLLHYAETASVAKILFNAGSDINCLLDDKTPLETALLNKNYKVALFLLSKNVPTSKLGLFDIFRLIKYLAPTCLKKLRQGDITPLHTLKRLIYQAALITAVAIVAISIAGAACFALGCSIYGIGRWCIIPLIQHAAHSVQLI